MRTCNTSLNSASGKEILTIEAPPGDPLLDAIRNAWVEKQVPQCGYCQSGMIMAAYGLLKKNRNPTETQIHSAMNGLCVCGTYTRVKSAIQHVAQNYPQ